MPQKPGNPSEANEVFNFKNILQTLLAMLKKWSLKINFILSVHSKEQNLLANETYYKEKHIKYNIKELKNLIRRTNTHPEKLEKITNGPISQLRKYLDNVLSGMTELSSVNLNLRHLYIYSDLTLSVFRGIMNDKIFHEDDLVKINNIDFSKWLEKHGANPKISLNNGPLKSLYDALFAYENGNLLKPNIEAGTALRVSGLFMASYQGGLMYKMQVNNKGCN